MLYKLYICYCSAHERLNVSNGINLKLKLILWRQISRTPPLHLYWSHVDGAVGLALTRLNAARRRSQWGRRNVLFKNSRVFVFSYFNLMQWLQYHKQLFYVFVIRHTQLVGLIRAVHASAGTSNVNAFLNVACLLGVTVIGMTYCRTNVLSVSFI